MVSGNPHSFIIHKVYLKYFLNVKISLFLNSGLKQD